MYEVNINAHPDQFLDWDKPLSAQSAYAQESLKKTMAGNWEQFNHANASTAVKQGFIAFTDEGVAQKLREAGIPGIKYLDQGSRAARETGTNNYVVFDQNPTNQHHQEVRNCRIRCILAAGSQFMHQVDHDHSFQPRNLREAVERKPSPAAQRTVPETRATLYGPTASTP